MDQQDAENLVAGTFRSALRLADVVDGLPQYTATRDQAERHLETVRQNVVLVERCCGDAVPAEVLELVHRIGSIIKPSDEPEDERLRAEYIMARDIGLRGTGEIREVAQRGLETLGTERKPPPVTGIEERPTSVTELRRQCMELIDFLASHDELSENSFGLNYARQKCRSLSEQARTLGLQLNVSMTPTETVDEVRDVLSALVEGCQSPGTKGGGDSCSQLDINMAGRTVTLDGIEYEVNSLQALRWLKVLNEHRGEWITASKLRDYDDQLDGVRTQDLKKYLPSLIRSLIDSKTGAGSRLKVEPLSNR